MLISVNYIWEILWYFKHMSAKRQCAIINMGARWWGSSVKLTVIIAIKSVWVGSAALL